MPLKLDGTNNKVIFFAGAANATTVTGALGATAWTLTLPTTAGVAGEVLTTDGTGAATWGPGGGALTVTNDTTTNAARYPVFADVISGTASTAYVSSPEYTYNPSSGQLSALHMASTAGMHLNSNNIAVPYTIPAGMNGLSAGPMTVASFANVTVPAGQSWKVV